MNDGKRQEGYTILEYIAGTVLVFAIMGLIVTSIGGGFRNLAKYYVSLDNNESNH